MLAPKKWKSMRRQWNTEDNMTDDFQYFNTLVKDMDMEWTIMDLKIVHHDLEGWREKKINPSTKALLRGKFSTKIYGACDARGNPIRVALTRGETSNYSQTLGLLHGLKAKVILADKMYDGDYIVDTVNNIGLIL